MSAPAIIEKLVKQFKADYETVKHEKEAVIRRDYIDKFFAALGWDMENSGGSRSLYRDVVVEDTVIGDDDATWAPDYSFGIGGDRKFFVEAKSVKSGIRTNRQAAVQVRRYSWNSKLPICVLTDFEDFVVFDARNEPHTTDRADTARLLTVNFERYVDRWEEIRERFSHEAVYDGSFDRWVGGLDKPVGLPVDQHFLRAVEDWRKALAIEIHKSNPRLGELDLKYAVTRIIDRIIFLRVCEARQQSDDKDSLDHKTRADAYPNLISLFKEADLRYNSGLFRFKKRPGQVEPPDEVTPGLTVDHAVVRRIIKQLYDREDSASMPSLFRAENATTPYDFRAMRVEVLGQMYEQFLGKTIIIDSQDRVDIVSKGEDRAQRRRQGVYYTPDYIVRYIVGKVLDPILEAKTPEAICKLRVLDPACGSGSFLLGAYQHLLKWYRLKYEEIYNETGTFEDVPLRGAANGTTALTLEERNRILCTHIFGVDLDAQAVEVTKLSLLLEAVKDEPKGVLDRLTRRGESALRDLGSNILCGNSLLGTDYLTGKKLSKEERRRLNCFDWNKRFPVAPDAGGFDVVIGNPPYVRQETLGADFKEYVESHYKGVYHGTADLYVYFIERAHELLKPGGRFGMICSNKWIRSNYGKPLRDYLAGHTTLQEIVDFGELRVFQDAATFPAIVLTRNESADRQHFTYAPIKTLDFASLTTEVGKTASAMDDRAIAGGNWTLASGDETAILDKMTSSSLLLKDYLNCGIFRGVITGLTEAFVIDGTTRAKLIARNKSSAELMKPFAIGDDVRKYHINVRDRYLILIPKGWTIDQCPVGGNPVTWFRRNYRALADHLAEFEEKAVQRQDQGDFWWELRACDYYDQFQKPKIVLPDIAKESRMAFDTSGLYLANTCYFIPTSDLYLLGLLNSKLMFAYFKRKAAVLGDADKGGRLRWFRQDVLKLPIRRIDPKDRADKSRHKKMVSLVEQIIERNREFAEDEWSHNKERLSGEIQAIDEEIDHLVYELYGLTPEEKAIVEGKDKLARHVSRDSSGVPSE